MLRKIRCTVRRSVPSAEDGFSLLEVMVSLVILATGLLMMIPMMITSMKGNVFADVNTRAVHHIRAKIEEIKNTHQFTSGSDCPDGMTRIWTVEQQGPNLKKITVQLNWLDKDSLEHENVVMTYESYN